VRFEARIVENHIPLSALQCFKVSVPVSDQLLNFREQVRVGASPVEERNHMSAGQGIADLMRADEACAAEDEYAKSPSLVAGEELGVEERPRSDQTVRQGADSENCGRGCSKKISSVHKMIFG
jgi:hypothetical protein